MFSFTNVLNTSSTYVPSQLILNRPEAEPLPISTLPERIPAKHRHILTYALESISRLDAGGGL